MTKAAALYKFYSLFGLTAYEENSVPEDASFPYLTYNVSTGSFGEDNAMYINLWYRSTSWAGINAKTEEISAAIGRGGKVIKCDDGAIWMKRGSPFAQSMGDPEDDLIKRKYINITAEYLTAE